MWKVDATFVVINASYQIVFFLQSWIRDVGAIGVVVNLLHLEIGWFQEVFVRWPGTRQSQSQWKREAKGLLIVVDRFILTFQSRRHRTKRRTSRSTRRSLLCKE